MDVEWPKPGHYVVAVSGGVDSMALLHMLQARPEFELAVAHFDHGIRADSIKDRRLVANTAKSYVLPFIHKEGYLGAGANEAQAREARYRFLRQAREDRGAQAIITAHHLDDVLETAILNMLRGTGRKGLTALNSRQDVIRPLLRVTKKELIQYAKKHGLDWEEDPSNEDINYLRNYIRHRLLPKFSEADTRRLATIVTSLTITNQQLDSLLTNQLHQQSTAGRLDRQWFNRLPHKVAREVLATWLRAYESGFDSKTLERLVVAAKTARSGKVFPVAKEVKMKVEAKHLALARSER